MPALTPRYNIAPTQVVPVVRIGAQGEHREVALMKWGLIPSWAKDAKIGNRMINARAETAVEKPAFRGAFKKRRCLVPADGFYEWMKAENGRKIPHLIRRRDGKPLAFAGLWETWHDQSAQQPIETFTILTTRANEVVRPIHDRMPVIVSPCDYETWLDVHEQDAEKLAEILKPAPAAELVAFPVSSRVNSPANDDAECVKKAQV
jgi:putative SOS response-associated peptidase YedK